MAGNWDDLDKHLEQLIKCYRSVGIPHGTAYELRDLGLRLTDSTQSLSDDQKKKLQKVIQAEAKRILERKFAQSENKETEKILKRRLGIRIQGEETPPSNTQPIDIEQFTNELLIAQFLASARELAKYPLEERNS